MPEPAEAASANPVQAPPSPQDIELEARLRGWIAGVTRRDEASFTELYNATVHRSWSVAMRIVRQQEAAEEVVEDCYWQVWREAGRFDAARGRVLTWILTICQPGARLLAAQGCRRAGRRHRNASFSRARG
jgi:RNA polymerase sigma-70 factor (ECF subfamily)